MAFSTLGLSPEVMEGVKALGYVEPTPVQEKTIPLILSGHDVIGCAQTGTGKTAAFALPMLTKLAGRGGATRVLILEPTRELAMQVEAAIRDMAKFTSLRITAIFGGVGYSRQTDALRNGVEFIVATPGRLIDHLERGNCHFNQLDYVVLDEADRMLDMGFLPDVRRILDHCPRKRLTCLYSATIPPEIETLIKWAMNNPQTVEIGARRSPAENIKHVVYPVAEDQKNQLVCELLNRVQYESVIVFCRTKRRADKLAKLLKADNHSVAVLHSSRTQRERERALQGFRDGRFEVLVATDIAARGLDITSVSHVINYDVPQHPEDYVHRIGRTGRAQAKGDAFTLMVAGEARPMAAIERFIGHPIERIKLDNFKYNYTTLLEKPAANQNQRSMAPMRVQGVRLGKGYFCGPVRRKRR
jgi:ATP-dependent RNA helicase RhlE